MKKEVYIGSSARRKNVILCCASLNKTEDTTLFNVHLHSFKLVTVQLCKRLLNALNCGVVKVDVEADMENEAGICEFNVSIKGTFRLPCWFIESYA